MSRELAHDKRVQAALSTTAAVAGLTALGTKGGGLAGRLALRRVPQLAARARVTPKAVERADKASVGLVTIGAGVGGAGGLKFAAIQRKEAKREDPHVVRKDYAQLKAKYEDNRFRTIGNKRHQEALNAGRFVKVGEQEDDRPSRLRTQMGIKAKPRSMPKKRKDYGGINPEANRQRRMKRETGAMAVGSAGAGAAAVGYGIQAGSNAGFARRTVPLAAQHRANRDRRVAESFRLNTAAYDNSGSRPRLTHPNLLEAAARESRGALRAGRAAERAEGYKTSAQKLARMRGKQAVVAGVGAAALGAGAAGMHHMRTKGQGRHYRDWWDG